MTTKNLVYLNRFGWVDYDNLIVPNGALLNAITLHNPYLLDMFTKATQRVIDDGGYVVEGAYIKAEFDSVKLGDFTVINKVKLLGQLAEPHLNDELLIKIAEYISDEENITKYYHNYSRPYTIKNFFGKYSNIERIHFSIRKLSDDDNESVISTTGLVKIDDKMPINAFITPLNNFLIENLTLLRNIVDNNDDGYAINFTYVSDLGNHRIVISGEKLIKAIPILLHGLVVEATYDDGASGETDEAPANEE